MQARTECRSGFTFPARHRLENREYANDWRIVQSRKTLKDRRRILEQEQSLQDIHSEHPVGTGVVC